MSKPSTGQRIHAKAGTDEIRQHYNTFVPARPIPEDYLDDSFGRAFYADDGSLIAHYLVKRGPGSRYLALIPPDERPNWLRDEDTCEVTALWMDKCVGRVQRFIVYFMMQVDLYAHGARRWVLVGTERPRLRARNRYTYHREVWVGDDARTGRTWFIDSLQRWRLPFRVVFVGIPCMAALQLVANRRKRGFELNKSTEAVR